MSQGEFALIARLVEAMPCRREDVVLGPGDDAAVLRPPAGMDLVQTVDTCLEGVHFPAGMAAEDVGWRSLAVNLSDLAAMGAEPAWGLLSLALPGADERWLQAFIRGVRAAAEEAAMAPGFDPGTAGERRALALVGGDMVRGPLAVSFTLTGFVPRGTALSRAGAAPDDEIWVTGPLGGGAAGLSAWRRGDVAGAEPFLRPRARVAEGGALRGLASAAIDVSDGLAQDLGHLLDASGVGAVVTAEALPVHPLASSSQAVSEALSMALNGGDDYQLCFTVPAQRRADLLAAAAGWSEPPVRIGVIRAQPGLELRSGGRAVPLPVGGWDHFKGQGT